jgi:hypothetical protein
VQIDETLIRVHRDWNGYRSAEVRLSDLEQIHWFQPLGAPRPLVHGFVSCASIVSGDIPHKCGPADGPHSLFVCVLKKHTVLSAYAELTRRADAQHVWPSNGRQPPLAAAR